MLARFHDRTQRGFRVECCYISSSSSRNSLGMNPVCEVPNCLEALDIILHHVLLLGGARKANDICCEAGGQYS